MVERREKFKSIASIESEIDSEDDHVKDSIVLDTYNSLKTTGKVTKLIKWTLLRYYDF